jgi:drug/metabolite transporter (DMT)-like permease
LVTLLCLLPLANFAEMRTALHIKDAAFWLNLVFSSAIVTTMATTIYFYSTTRLGAEKASSFIFLVPLAAAMSSWLMLGEQIQVHTAVGGILGITAVYFINKRKPVAIDVAGE